MASWELSPAFSHDAVYGCGGSGSCGSANCDPLHCPQHPRPGPAERNAATIMATLRDAQDSLERVSAEAAAATKGQQQANLDLDTVRGALRPFPPSVPVVWWGGWVMDAQQPAAQDLDSMPQHASTASPPSNLSLS